MPVLVGVDAGGSGTVAVADLDGTLTRAEGAPANARTGGIEAAAAAILSTVEEALGGESADALFIGAAGAGDAVIARRLREALVARLPQTRIEISDDARIALRAAVSSGDGGVLIVGTGAIAYAEAEGKTYRIGGHGSLLGDDGSGFAIGAAALRLLLRSYDGRAPRDALLEALERHYTIGDAPSVLERIHSSPSPFAQIASAAPVVIAAASGGERSATKIVQAAAFELAELVYALCVAAQLEQRDAPLALCGGLLRQNSMLTLLLEARVMNELPRLRLVKDAVEPEFGALAAARTLLERR